MMGLHYHSLQRSIAKPQFLHYNKVLSVESMKPGKLNGHFE
jgi:hypothetical protein